MHGVCTQHTDGVWCLLAQQLNQSQGCPACCNMFVNSSVVSANVSAVTAGQGERSITALGACLERNKVLKG